MPVLQLEDDLPLIEDLRSLFLQDIPMLDVRAPVEFQDGAFPMSTNLPLMSDADREAIGKRYKHAGQDEAIALGLERVSGTIKRERVQSWEDFARQHPQGVLYCFRGGLRSKISQQWLYEQTGIRYPRVQGGYKAMRRFLINLLEEIPAQLQPVVLSGRTGSGKTRFLKTFTSQVNLEGLANHRGSAFGGQPTPQPTQISFENALAVELLRHVDAGHHRLLLEDESRRIGSRHLPSSFFECMSRSPLVMIEVPDEERVEISYQEYVLDTSAAFKALHGGDADAGFAAFSEYLLGSLDKIRRRLGGERHQQARQMMQTALARQASHGETVMHYDWVRFILLDYYDPMYDYQISKKQERLAFKGTPAEVREYLATQEIR